MKRGKRIQTYAFLDVNVQVWTGVNDKKTRQCGRDLMEGIPFHEQRFVTCHWSTPFGHVLKRPGERNIDQHLSSPNAINTSLIR